MTAAAWLYERIDGEGRRTKGTVDASSYDEAFDQARNGGLYTVVDLESTTTLSGSVSYALSRVGDNSRRLISARINFWRLLRVHVREGREKNALLTYIPVCPSPRLKAALEGILSKLGRDGYTLVTALGDYPTIFDPTRVAMLENAEKTGKTVEALTIIIDDEQSDMSIKKSSILDRLDSYVTYVATLFTLFTVAKFILPSTKQQAEQAHMTSSIWIHMLDALGFLGTLLVNPLFYLAMVPLLLVFRWLVRLTGSHDDLVHLAEKIRWTVPFIKAADLASDQVRVLKIMADCVYAGLPDSAIFEHGLRAAKSLTFGSALRTQFDTVASGAATLEQSFADNPHWGLEITSYFASFTGGSWHEDVQDMVRTKTEDLEHSRRLSAYSTTAMHAIAALAMTAAVTIIVTVVQFAVLIETARHTS